MRTATRERQSEDIHVGERVRLRRRIVGMSQETLAEQIGVTFQQVQKYESGWNRISASRLCAISRSLKAPVAWFFEDITGGDISARDPLNNPENLALIDDYQRLGEKQRAAVREMISALRGA